MRLLFVADGRSPIALNWIQYFLQGEHEVHLVSTFPSAQIPGLSSFCVIPVAFSSLKTRPADGSQRGSGIKVAVKARTSIRQWLGPLTINASVLRLINVICELKPDLVHAMRIPYEGMLASRAIRKVYLKNPQHLPVPLLVSVWGNDFTLHAASTPLMSYLTRDTMRHAAGLHTDCDRDRRLAYRWGFDQEKPAMVVPGGGGIQQDIFYPSELPVLEPVVINPRGIRAYINNKAFFEAAALVLKSLPNTRFLCPGMENEPQAWRWTKELGISTQCELLPPQNRSEMAALFRRSRLSVSPSNHDGTPNTLLEAMSCGCLPVAGDLESYPRMDYPCREWLAGQPQRPT